jgi:transcription elongation GreA/GreB family factor
METSEVSGSKLTALREHLDDGDFDSFEDVWMEVLQEPDSIGPSELGQLLDIGQDLVAKTLNLTREESRAHTLLELLLPIAAQVSANSPGAPGGLGQPELRLLRLLLRVAPSKREYRNRFVELFDELFDASSAERAFFDAVGLRESQDLRRAIERFERLSRFVPGAVVYHESGWGIGQVLDIDPIVGHVRVDLEHKKDHRIALAAVDSILQVIPEHGFRALRFRGGQALRDLALNDPVRLVETVLESFGNPMPLKDLKGRLVPDVIQLADWTRWWGGAKARLRETGRFRIGDRSPFRVERLSRKTSYDEDLASQFATASWKDQCQISRLVFKGGPAEYPRAFETIRAELRKLVDDPVAAEKSANHGRTSGSAGKSVVAERRIFAALLLSRVDSDGDSSGSASLRLALSQTDTDTLLQVLENNNQGEEIQALLLAFREARPEAARSVFRQAHLAKSDTLRDEVRRHLEEREPATIAEFVQELLRSPRLSPEAFCWYAERRFKKDQSSVSLEPLVQLSDREFLSVVMDVLEHVIDRSARVSYVALKDVFRRLEGILYHRQGAFFGDTVVEFPHATLSTIHRRLVQCNDYFQRYGTRLIEILTTRVPRLTQDEADDHIWWDRDAIYVTERGLQRRMDEFRVLTQEKIPAIIEAIGRAAEFGDLSENAEYTSALEERDMLTKRGAAMEAEIKKVKVLGPEDVKDDDRISLGHRVRAKDLDTGEEKTYSILGPWDGSPEDGVISYRSPLGEIFLGHRLGEEFVAELPGSTRRLKILAISSHFEPAPSSV